VSQSCWNTW